MNKIIITMILIMTSNFLSAGARFTDNGDGTVRDNGTGLLWQKCSYGQSTPDCSGIGGTRTWQQSLQYCRNLPLAGRSWRLPNVNELKSIVDFSSYAPAINTIFFPNTHTSYYWSSSTVSLDVDNAWFVAFGLGGNVQYSEKTLGYYVRCVTDGP